MSQPGTFWWQEYGTLAQMAQACVSLLLGFVAIPLTASVTPPDCRFAKT